MSGVAGTGSKVVVNAGSAAAVDGPSAKSSPANDVDATDLLPAPFAPAATDDFATTLALMTLQQKHEDRVANDAQARAATKTQEAAQARKIEKMHELADDTFADGLVDGVTEAVSAVATGVSAWVKFQGQTKPGDEGNRLIRNASLIEVAGGGLKAGGKFVQAAYKRSQEIDRADMAVADQEIERAKGAADAASTQSRRDDDDMRETISSIRSYSNAKAQLQQSAIIRA